MLRVTLQGLFAHKVRYALTAVAVLLGVSFMAATFIVTDTVARTFDGLFTDVYHSTSAVVRASQSFTPQANFTNHRQPIDAQLGDKVRQVPGVAEIRYSVAGYAQLVGSNGKAIGNPGAGAPTLGETWNNISAMNPYNLLPGGRPPRTGSEVAIDKRSADVGHLHVGDRVTVLTKQAPARYTITGIVRWESADSPLGASITLFDLGTAQRVLGEPGKVDEIDVSAAPGVSQQTLVSRLRTALADPKLDIVTGKDVTKEAQSGVRNALAFFNTFLMVFALIALFVGSFLIFNTFSITVAQRGRELALLRAIGASRSQVMGSVLCESLAIGAVASCAGLGVGIGLAVALKALLGAVGIDIPSAGLEISLRTILICVLTGTVITVCAAVTPAFRASKIAPVAVLRSADLGGEKGRTRRLVSGLVVTAVSLVALAAGLFGHGSNQLPLVGIGATSLFIGASVLAPLFSRPFSHAIGAPLAWRGPTGTLARNNAMRNPKRTARTAAALMVGVAVVALMSVVAASAKASVAAGVDSMMRADFVISSGGQPGGPTGFSPALASKLNGLPQVATAGGVRGAVARIDGSTTTVLAVDPQHLNDLFDIDVAHGDIAAMSATGIAVSQHVADAQHLSLGSSLPVQFTTTGTKNFTVQSIYRSRQVAGDYVLPLAAAEQNFSQQLDFQIYVKLGAGVTPADGRRAIDAAASNYPTATVMDRTEYKAQQISQIDQLLNLVFGLLGLALVIALMGIANTLVLSIHERTRELGLLRAVGMTRRQLRTTVRSESVIISLFGAVEGLVLGTLLGWAIVAALSSHGVSRLSIPVTQLIVIAAIAGLAGVIAALAPGRRAARLDVLHAITQE
jgi:putative ABC transport system permease protein